MNIALCYIAVSNGSITEDYCARFVGSYCMNPPGVEHETLVVCNGGPLPEALGLMFAAIDARFYPRVNDAGRDVSAYIELARGACSKFDMMVCMGESVYFWREGWLEPLVKAWKKNGPGMYGPFASNMIRAHLNTTAFCIPPAALAQYPAPMWNQEARYGFEHGPQSLWRWCASRGMPARLVTWDGDYEPRAWRSPPNILWRGDQTNCLFWCNHTERWANAEPTVRARWSRNADAPYK